MVSKGRMGLEEGRDGMEDAVLLHPCEARAKEGRRSRVAAEHADQIIQMCTTQ